MSNFTFIGQGTKETSSSKSFVVKNEEPISFQIDTGAESAVNSSSAESDALNDDRISYTNYSGVEIEDAQFTVTYVGQANWANGKVDVPDQFTSKIAIIRITSGEDSGQTYTLIIDNPPDPNAAPPNQGSSQGTFTKGVHRAVESENSAFCFAKGTMIDTVDGPIAVEGLSTGDMVVTADHGAMPIRWIGAVTVPATGRNRPIRIAAGALGPDIPHLPLTVSPAHRILLSGLCAELLFGCNKLLVHAEDIVNDSTIRPLNGAGFVRYYHLLFDHHEIIYANGAPAESFHPGQAVDGPGANRNLEELMRLFPERFRSSALEPSVHPTLGRSEARLLIANLG